tara:strand:- start:265 stop:438 length:174 start_codon:yes stop_codon:yes gene_type:complete
MSKEQLEIPFDHEPSINHQAKLIADEMVESGECLNWDYAYETSWNALEYQYKINKGE